MDPKYNRLYVFKINIFKNSFRNTVSECQTVWIHLDQDSFVGPDPGPNCLLKYSASDKKLTRKELKNQQTCKCGLEI